ncbi:MAG: flagellin lysine-N-methylase [Fibrobacter sp.]|nr:flagellin lysine-N-methylase [Fibrobacter sp.]
MLLRVPSFFNQFHCIAGKCTDTCCVGWEIDVDERTLAKYKGLAELNGSAGKSCCKTKDNPEENCNKQKAFIKTLLENIEDGHFILKPGDRCPFLKEDGLCDMICNLGCNGTDLDDKGESVLCDICREHPRFVEVYGDVMEKGLGLCCEEAVRLLLTSNSHPEDNSHHRRHPELREGSSTEQGNATLTFIESEIDDEPDEMPDGVEEARDAIFEEREAIFAILNDRDTPLNQRLIEILDFALAMSDCDKSENSNDSENLSEQAIYQTWIEILGEGESFGPAWDAAYERMVRKGWQQPQPLFTDEDGARIVAYLIFRYYAKSLFDGDNLTKVQFAIYFWIILERFGKELAGFTADSGLRWDNEADLLTAKINAVKLLSKQTEYSEEIMEILTDNFFENPAFSVEQFRRILSQASSSTSMSP